MARLKVLKPCKRAPKAKLIHVIRHGEAQHNVNDKFLLKHDTKLTKRGQRQAKSLHKLLPKLKPQVAVSSAVLRALQTTRGIGFAGPTVVSPEAREVGGWPANSPIESKEALSCELASQFGRYDWSLVAGPQRSDTMRWEPESEIKDRAKRLSRFLERRPEKSLLLVSHGEFLQHLTSDKYMGNCEVRTYSLYRGKWQRLRRVKCSE
ncbi:Probable phosphatase SPAC513.02 [Durusdinium trenchii]|uniref:Probable phosphatase SPAC513.02 n=1 Tax=Durusdinium trenchii TaxID=1381693 RepID=A0ABP0K2I5_9DINO|eukprot:g14096.t2